MSYGICKVCGCTDNDPCFNPENGLCWWVDETHELCSHCADLKIYNDPATRHCVNSANQSLAEVLVCKNCEYWHKDNDSDDARNEDVYGKCDYLEFVINGNDSICADFEEKEN